MRTAPASKPSSSGSATPGRPNRPADLRSRPSLPPFLLGAAALLAAVPGTVAPAAAARGVQARVVLVNPGGSRQEMEMTRIRFVHYRRRLSRWGRWEKPEQGGRRRTEVTLKPHDERYQSRYLLFEDDGLGIPLNDVCRIEPFYRENGSGRRELHLAVTDRKGRRRDHRVLDLRDGYQPVEVHFSGRRRGRRYDLPLPPLFDGREPSRKAVLEQIIFLYRDCRRR